MSQIKVNSIVPAGGLPAGANGGIIQVVNTIKTDVFTTDQSSSGDETEITGLNATITPSSNANKILISVVLNSGNHGTTYGFFIKRGTTTVDALRGDAASSRKRVTAATGIPQDTNQMTSCSCMVLDSPATTSAITYKIFVKSDAGTFRLNRSSQDQDNNTGSRTVSSITLMEVSV
tara:strand:- start:60 stop:587 length:528 start_codon:yes stop_codon:yes gene_type:complete